MSVRSGAISALFLDWIKENPSVLQSYVNDLFISDHRRFEHAAEENDEMTLFLVGLRELGSHTFKLEGSFDPDGSMGEARLNGELNGRYKESEWFLVYVKPRSESFAGSQVYGFVEELDGPQEAHSMTQEIGSTPEAPALS